MVMRMRMLISLFILFTVSLLSLALVAGIPFPSILYLLLDCNIFRHVYLPPAAQTAFFVQLFYDHFLQLGLLSLLYGGNNGGGGGDDYLLWYGFIKEICNVM